MPQIERGEYGVAMLVAAGDSRCDSGRGSTASTVSRPPTTETANWHGFNWLDPVVARDKHSTWAGGRGHAGHLAGEMFKSSAKRRLHVPYKGGSPRH